MLPVMSTGALPGRSAEMFSPICGENYVAACGRPYLSSGIVDFDLLEAM